MSKPAAAKVYVVIYSVYHHVHKLAIEVQKGLEPTGVSAKMFQGKRIFLFTAKAPTYFLFFEKNK